MAQEPVRRRLAAIMAADVVGYSRLMGLDEEGTLAALKSLRAQLLDPEIAAHGGRIVKTLGDGVLVEFESAHDAVRCAAVVQRAAAGLQSGVPEDRRLRLRIGINVGDVIVEGDDLFGDGVNVTARLEALAEPGGICVSATVHDQVRGRLDLAFEDVGLHQLKNLTHPVHAFAVQLDAPAVAAACPPPPERPSIAVLPFDNLSGDPEQAYFSDAVSEEIITALSRIRWFVVIARHSSFAYKGRPVDTRAIARELGVRYLVEGTVRRSGDRVRVTAQLVDAARAAQVWARRYDRELVDIFDVQDEITEAVVGEIEPELAKAERQRAILKKPDNLDAWDLCQRGLSHLYRYTRADLDAALGCFARAIELDPGLGPAHSATAEAYYYSYVYGFAASLADCRELALPPARLAVELDMEDAAAHCTLGRVHYLRREHAAAISELETALALSPSLALAHYGLGAALVFVGRAGDALPHLERAIRLSPHDINMGSFLVRMADAHLLMGDHLAAVEWARRALRQPAFQWSRYAALLSALGHLGRTDEAGAVLAELRQHRPDFGCGFVERGHLHTHASSLAHYLEGLRKAGVPE